MTKYGKIVQSVIDYKGKGCIGSESECKTCPIRKHCGDDDEKHLRSALNYKIKRRTK